jgi:hypothetical protein
MNRQAAQSGAVTEISLELTTHVDDFQEIKRSKRHISNNTSQAAKKSTKSVPKSAAGKLPTKAVITRNFFAPLTTNDMDIETTGAENILPEKEVPRKSGRSQPIMMTSTTNLIRLQSDFKNHVKRRGRVPKYKKWNSYHNKRNSGLFSNEILIHSWS